MKYSAMNFDTYFIRPTNGHSSPGIKCPGSLYIYRSWNSMEESIEYSQHWIIMPRRRRHQEEGQTDSVYMAAHAFLAW
eukprot:8003437-Pyramimonas_sp.AAC.1